MEYTNITLGRYADVPFFDKLKNNFQYFVEQMSAKGYISELLPVDLWDDVTYSMALTEIQNLFINIERVMYEIDVNSDWINDYSYYVDHGENNPTHWFEWAKKQPNKYMLVKRWINWMNYNYLIISGQEQKKQYLWAENENTDENGVTEQVYDINGEPIKTFEGYF